jgi:hypothetical protein
MSDYEESYVSASKISSVSSKFKKPAKLKPGVLPWEEESMTYSRHNGSLFLKLQRENTELRQKLKEFNSKLNEIIFMNTKKKPLIKTRLDFDPLEASEIAKKKEKYYE